MKKSISFISTNGTALCQRVSAGFFALREKRGRTVMFVLAVALIALSLSLDASAQAKYSDQQAVDSAVNAMRLFFENSFGVIIMAASVLVAFGALIIALVTALLKKYKLALSFLLAAFIIPFTGVIAGLIYNYSYHTARYSQDL